MQGCPLASKSPKKRKQEKENEEAPVAKVSKVKTENDQGKKKGPLVKKKKDSNSKNETDTTPVLDEISIIKTEPLSPQKNDELTVKNSEDDSLDEEQRCFREAERALRSLSGDVDGSEPLTYSCPTAAKKGENNEEIQIKHEVLNKDEVKKDEKKQIIGEKTLEVEIKVEEEDENKTEDILNTSISSSSSEVEILMKIEQECATIQSQSKEKGLVDKTSHSKPLAYNQSESGGLKETIIDESQIKKDICDNTECTEVTNTDSGISVVKITKETVQSQLLSVKVEDTDSGKMVIVPLYQKTKTKIDGSETKQCQTADVNTSVSDSGMGSENETENPADDLNDSDEDGEFTVVAEWTGSVTGNQDIASRCDIPDTDKPDEPPSGDDKNDKGNYGDKQAIVYVF